MGIFLSGCSGELRFFLVRISGVYLIFILLVGWILVLSVLVMSCVFR